MVMFMRVGIDYAIIRIGGIDMPLYLPIALFLAAIIVHLIVAFGGNSPKVNLTSLANAFLALALMLCLVRM